MNITPDPAEPPDPCAGRHLLIQADLDGELDVASSAALATHVAGCPACSDLRERLITLSGRLRSDMPRHAAPNSLRARLTQGAAIVRLPLPSPETKRRRGWFGFGTFGAGAAVAAMLLLALMPRHADDEAALIGLHLRALQPGHLTDVISTDRHTVKPWFDGRIDFAPEVKDLAASGFPLLGGRLDVLVERPVAALVYGHGKHVIDVVVEPGPARADSSITRQGYTVVGWSGAGLRYRAVSDVATADLDEFVRLWKAAP